MLEGRCGLTCTWHTGIWPQDPKFPPEWASCRAHQSLLGPALLQFPAVTETDDQLCEAPGVKEPSAPGAAPSRLPSAAPGSLCESPSAWAFKKGCCHFPQPLHLAWEAGPSCSSQHISPYPVALGCALGRAPAQGFHSWGG